MSSIYETQLDLVSDIIGMEKSEEKVKIRATNALVKKNKQQYYDKYDD